MTPSASDPSRHGTAPVRSPDADRAPQSFRLVLSQLRPQKGAVERNLARVATEAETWAGRADVLVLPETFLSGYFVEGGVEDVAITADQIVRGLGAPPAGAPDLVLGAYERGAEGIHNTAFHFTPDDERWRVLHRHRKTFLPTYGVFDEARFVVRGARIRAYDTRFGRMGLLICEEMLHSLAPMALALQGADLMVCLAASPARDFDAGRARPGNLERWDLAGRAITLEHGTHLAVAQAVGSEGGRLFAGGSVLYGPGGTVEARAACFEEHRLECTIDPRGVERQRIRSPLLSNLREALPRLGAEVPGLPGGPRDLAPTAPLRKRHDPAGADRASSVRPSSPSSLELELPLVEQALVTFLRQEIRERRGFGSVVLGVSGGVDSAVSLALAVRALGADAVHPFLLPYRTSSEESLEHGTMVCRELGLEPRTIPISEGIDAYIGSETPEISPLRRGNLAARFRALVLWDQSARLDALVLGTGNKSERLLGYYTWHADDSPPINPLGDLFKTQVVELAEYLGIPDEIVQKRPSADLVQGVDDEDELGFTYREADPILNGLLEGFQAAELVALGHDPDLVDRVAVRLHGTHWKRELPTVAMISSTAIGAFYLRPVDY